ncbi:hypothetical protein FK514_30085, partial [Klebsiella pneumoniae]|nr:hypothetical protein [Klebsiella pneumoniae]
MHGEPRQENEMLPLCQRNGVAVIPWSPLARGRLSLAFPLWRGILGDNSLLGASYTQKSWWQLSNSK